MGTDPVIQNEINSAGIRAHEEIKALETELPRWQFLLSHTTGNKLSDSDAVTCDNTGQELQRQQGGRRPQSRGPRPQDIQGTGHSHTTPQWHICTPQPRETPSLC